MGIYLNPGNIEFWESNGVGFALRDILVKSCLSGSVMIRGIQTNNMTA